MMKPSRWHLARSIDSIAYNMQIKSNFNIQSFLILSQNDFSTINRVCIQNTICFFFNIYCGNFSVVDIQLLFKRIIKVRQIFKGEKIRRSFHICWKNLSLLMLIVRLTKD